MLLNQRLLFPATLIFDPIYPDSLLKFCLSFPPCHLPNEFVHRFLFMAIAPGAKMPVHLLGLPSPGDGEEFRTSDDRSRILQLGWIGDPLEDRAGLPCAQRVHPRVPQMVDSVVPRRQHPFSCVLEASMAVHHLPNRRSGVCQDAPMESIAGSPDIFRIDPSPEGGQQSAE